MVQVSERMTIQRSDLELMLGCLPVLIERAQALTFDSGGVFVHGGIRRDGLTLVGGRPPDAGTVYLLRVGAANQDQGTDVQAPSDVDGLSGPSWWGRPVLRQVASRPVDGIRHAPC